MTAKAAAQFDYDLVTDEPYKSNLHVQAKQKLIKKVCQKPLSHESDCSGSRSMNLHRASAMVQN